MAAITLGAALALIVHGCIVPAFGQQAPPNDAALYSVLVVLNAPEQPADAALVAAMRSHPALVKICGDVKFFKFPANDRLFIDRYAATLRPGALPMVALIRSDGGILYKVEGPAIPAPDELARRLVEIATADRIANPRTINAGPVPTGPSYGDAGAIPWPAFPPGFPGGFPGAQVVPRLIPGLLDGILSPTISPKIQIPPEVGYVAMAAVVVAVGLGGLFIFGVAILAALLVFRD
jgi:hypothetical protein